MWNKDQGHEDRDLADWDATLAKALGVEADVKTGRACERRATPRLSGMVGSRTSGWKPEVSGAEVILEALDRADSVAFLTGIHGLRARFDAASRLEISPRSQRSRMRRTRPDVFSHFH